MTGDADETQRETSRLISSNNSSMELLNRIAASSLDPGYTKFKGQQQTSVPAKVLTLLLCAFIAFFATIAVTGMRQTSQNEPSTTSELAKQVEQKRKQVDQLESRVSTLSDQVQSQKESVASSQGLSPELETTAALRRVEGEGVAVTLTESVTTGTVAVVDDGAVRAVINALWAGGAEAIAVNGQRVGPQSVVRMAGQQILVNLRAVRNPYVVEAIGDPAKLKDSLGSDPQVQKLHSKAGMSLSVALSDKLILGAVPMSQTWYVRAAEIGKE